MRPRFGKRFGGSEGMTGLTDMIGSTITAIPTKIGSFCLYRALFLIKTPGWEQIHQRFGAQIG
jgi:hypothetical protein